ncbi:hypothetical protein AACH10_07720 [Ideonella sp. DXS22W]|uniref:O-antigen ligase domain-containing protein n=1 Tax=Pseudaquabacterium inlustre TaxID=2984192 RepID=A0ABU9CHW9_9BURK
MKIQFPRAPMAAHVAIAMGTVVLILLSVVAVLSNSPPIIGLVVAAVGASILAAAPRISVSLLLVLGLAVDGVVVLLLPALGKISWLLSGLGLLLFANAAFSLLGRRMAFAGHAATKVRQIDSAPALAALLFVAYALLVSLANGSGPFEVAAGFKRYFQYWGLLFALAVMPFAVADRARWLRWLLYLAGVQIVFAIYQRWVLMPKRVGMGHGVVPVDVVAGTFGATLDGGGQSAAMAAFLLVVLMFLMVAWRERALPRTRIAGLAVLAALPLGMGETKIVVLLLPMLLLVAQARYLKSRPVTTLLLLVVGATAAAGLALLYLSMTGKPGQSIEDRLAVTLAYNFGQLGYSGQTFTLNRSTALSFWWHQQSAGDPLHTVFGHGLGSSYYGAGALVVGHLARQFGFIDIGLTAVSTLLWDLGLAGLLIYLSIFGFTWRALRRIGGRVSTPLDIAKLAALRCAVLSFLVLSFYSNAIVAAASSGILFALVIGHIVAWSGSAPAAPVSARATSLGNRFASPARPH